MMTPEIRLAIQKAFDELSSLSAEDLRDKMDAFASDDLTLTLNSLTEFMLEGVFQNLLATFTSQHKSQKIDIEEADFQDFDLLIDAANDERYLLAA